MPFRTVGIFALAVLRQASAQAQSSVCTCLPQHDDTSSHVSRVRSVAPTTMRCSMARGGRRQKGAEAWIAQRCALADPSAAR